MPTTLDPQTIGQDSLAAQLGLAGQQFVGESIYGPLYNNLQQANLRRTLLGGELPQNDVFAQFPGLEQAYQTWSANMQANGGENPDLSRQTFLGEHFRAFPNDPAIRYLAGDTQPGLIDTLGEASTQIQDIQTGLNTRQRTADINDVATLGPAANEAFRASNPQLAGVLDDLVSRTSGEGSVNGVSPITNTLEQRALGELELGGQLSEVQRRNLEQSSRSAFSARNLGTSQASAVDEALRNMDASRAIERERQQFAAGVAGMGQQERLQNNAQLGQTGQLLGGLAQDPFMSIVGRPSTALGAGQSALGQGGAFNQSSGPGLFNPYDPSILGVYSDNQANETARKTAGKNNDSQLLGAALTAAAIFFCWVARAAYGPENPRWLQVRTWMLNKAPKSLFRLYCRNGPALAEKVKGDPALRARVCGLLDALVPDLGQGAGGPFDKLRAGRGQGLESEAA